ncbi:hypothetical protein SAMN06295973_1476 [Plantibacter cousiniae]|uniref:Uncharacterized protein n=1 Tax=Plantibacter cousiniae (nom. nud.) TaxID=199709 RepID=A0ABY1LMF2_9MICO|nr:hypothetical protein SAMN06295973_1476 [Plantibacter cousiniae]
MDVRWWVVILTIAGAMVTGWGLFSALVDGRREYLRVLREEAQLRRLKKRHSREIVGLTSTDPAYQSSEARMWSEWHRLKLPTTTYLDIEILPTTLGRSILGHALKQVRGDLVTVGIGLAISTVASVWSIWI